MRLSLIIFILLINCNLNCMENKKPYRHIENGKFRNPEGSPERDLKLNGLIKFLTKRKN